MIKEWLSFFGMMFGVLIVAFITFTVCWILYTLVAALV